MRRSTMISPVRATAVVVVVVLAGCTSSPGSEGPPARRTSRVDKGVTSPSEGRPVSTIGDFPKLPMSSLPVSTADSLQAVLDGAVESGTLGGVTAAVVVGGSGAWSGAAGDDAEGIRLTPRSRLLTASIAKTVTAAEVLHLVDQGKLGLDDPIADRLPRTAVSAFDANGATIRDVLGMRSGIADPPGYVGLVDSGLSPGELLEKTARPVSAAGSRIAYADINYLLLGMVLEHVTGRPLYAVLRSGVLHRPGLDGLVYPRKDALAADGCPTGPYTT
jgi:CubicO group peptidase (beta-lactamase class C family)